jgi:hypothetical protein
VFGKISSMGIKACLEYDLGRFGDRMTTRHQNPWRSFQAIVCLFAVVLLFAPLAAAAWSSYSAACCTSGQCPIKSHHHQHSSSSENPMNCGHEMPGMAACSMSCCHDLDRLAISPGLFLLPAPVTIYAPSILKSPFDLLEPMNFHRSFKPLSPPPRISPAAA